MTFTFKEDEYQEGKEYDYFGILVYDGEFKNGEYSGSGTLYYDGSSSIKYKGTVSYTHLISQILLQNIIMD